MTENEPPASNDPIEQMAVELSEAIDRLERVRDHATSTDRHITDEELAQIVSDLRDVAMICGSLYRAFMETWEELNVENREEEEG